MQKVIQVGMQQLDDVDSNASTDVASTLATLGFTVAKPEDASGYIKKSDHIIVQVEGASVRVGKGTPTTSLGLPTDPGEQVILESIKEVEETKFISAIAGVHATLQAQIGYNS